MYHWYFEKSIKFKQKTTNWKESIFIFWRKERQLFCYNCITTVSCLLEGVSWWTSNSDSVFFSPGEANTWLWSEGQLKMPFSLSGISCLIDGEARSDRTHLLLFFFFEYLLRLLELIIYEGLQNMTCHFDIFRKILKRPL